ncbi:uncharacterized protein [Haliotis asinina]|uniref:uncharacterized protein n=1 Tax=Haliotis asinina TaxID=109174 RepID=UPI003531E5F6
MSSNCLQVKTYSCLAEEEEFVKNIPVVIMFSLFSAVGVVGNVFILYIYGLKFKESTTRVFILSLAVFDLISCVMLPYKITLLRYGSLFSNPNLARLEIVRIYFLQGSVSILPLMSFDRYRRICQPLKVQMKPKVAKVLVTSVIAIMTIFTIVRMVVTNYTNDQCYRAEAFVSAEFVDRTVQIWLKELNFIFVILPFILPLPILIVVYILIGVKVRRLSKAVNKGGEGSQDTTLTKCPQSSATDKHVVAKEDVGGSLLSALPTSSTGGPKVVQSDTGTQSETRDCGSNSNSSFHNPTRASAYSTGVATVSGTECSEKALASRRHFFLEMNIKRRNKRFNKVYPKHVRIPRVWDKMAPKGITFNQKVETQQGKELSSSDWRCSDQPTSDPTVKRQTNAELHLENSISSFTAEQDTICKTISLEKSVNGEDPVVLEQACISAQNPQPQDLKDLMPSQHSATDKKLPWKRMTLIFFLITIVYILSCLPFFIIYIIFRVAPCYGYELLSQGGYIVLYNFVYITTVSNCFLYGFFDPRFKRELKCVTSFIPDRLCRKCKIEDDDV